MRSGILEAVLQKLVHFSIARRRVVFVLSGLLAAVSILLASQLRLDPDILNLVPANNREVNEFRTVLRRLGTIDQHVIVVEIPKGADAESYTPLIDSLIARLRALPEVRSVEGTLPEPLSLVEELLPHALLFLSPTEVEKVAERFTDSAIREQVTRNKTLLQTPQSTAVEELVRQDPFGLLPIFMEKFRRPAAGLKIDAASGYYLSADHTMYVIVVKPRKPAQDLPFGQGLLAKTKQATAAAMSEFRSAQPEVPLPAINETGGYAIALDDARLIRRDVLLNVVSSTVLILLLFLYAFRRLASVFYAAVPMLLSILMTFAVAYLVFRVLSPASAVFGALVAGLGIDFITVLYERYIDERNHGKELEPAFQEVFRTTVPGVIVAAITTAGTFFAYLANQFRGMSQLGFLVGVGILFFLLAVLTLMPALIAAFEGKRAHRPIVLRSFLSDHLVTVALRRPRVTIVAWMILVLLFGFFARKTRFEGEISSFRAEGNASTELQGRVAAKLGQSFSAMMHVTEGPTVQAAVEKAYGAVPQLDTLVEKKAIGSYQSIATLLPLESRQREVIALVRERSAQFDFERIATTFRAALAENGFRADAYDEVLLSYRRMLSPDEPVRFEDLSSTSLGPLLERFVRKEGETATAITYLYPNGKSWPRDVPQPILEWRDRDTSTVITGSNLVSATLKNIIQRDALIATAAAFVAIFLLFALVYRSISRAALMFVPLLAGSIIMMGAMALLDISFNLVNVFVGLMLVGVATDYAIYIGQRYYESPENFPSAAPETGKAVAMAAMTSMLGFGSFVISHFPGMRSIGYASLLGIGFSYLASITLLPAILVSMRRRSEAREVARS